MLKDNFRHQGLRKKLVETIRNKGIIHERVLEAIGNVPRHLFMENAFLEFAYEDKAFPIDCNQTISQPFTVAYQTQLLDPTKGEKILEVGTGSGYQSAVLAAMNARVFSIERHKPLFEKTKKLLEMLNYTSIKTFYGDGFKGLPAFAPFDKMIVTCGAPEVPSALLNQLKIGGLLVIPVGKGDIQIMTTVLKRGQTEFETMQFNEFKFVPMLGSKA